MEKRKRKSGLSKRMKALMMLVVLLLNTGVQPTMVLAETVSNAQAEQTTVKSEVVETEKSQGEEDKNGSEKLQTLTSDSFPDPIKKSENANANDSPQVNDSSNDTTNQSVEELKDPVEDSSDSEADAKEGPNQVDLEKIKELASRPHPENLNTSGLSDEEIEQLGLAIFGEYHPEGTETLMKNDKGEDVKIPYKIMRNSRAIAGSSTFNMNYVLTGFGTTSRYTVINHHWLGNTYAYCIEPNVLFQSGTDYAQTEADLSQEQWRRVNEVLNFGAKDSSNDKISGYTQLKVWEMLGWTVTTVGGIGELHDFYVWSADIDRQVADWKRRASWHRQTVTVRVGDSITLTDTNSSVNTMNLMGKPNNTTVTKNGNKVTIKVDNANAASGRITFQRPSAVSGVALMWNNGSGGQACMSAGAMDPNLNQSYIDLKVEKLGKVKIKKSMEDNESTADVRYSVVIKEGNNTLYSNENVSLNASGEWTSGDYPQGAVAYVKETKTKNGFVLDTKEYTIAFKAAETVQLNLNNKKFRAKLNILKRDKESDDVPQGDATFEGAQFELRKKDGSVIKKVTTNASGAAVIENLVPGKYDLVETKAPAGYLLDSKPQEIVVTQDSPTQATKELTAIHKNQVIRGDIVGLKHTDGEWEINKWGNNPLANAEFSLIDSKGNVVKKVISDENGAFIIKDVLYGDYILRETGAPEGYDPVPDTAVKISENGKAISFTLTDPVKRAKVRITKKDAESSKPINYAGTEFKLKNLQTGKFEKHVVENRITEVFTTDEKGSVMTSRDLMFGKYELHEIKAPKNYATTGQIVPFSINGEINIVELEYKNPRVKGEVTLTKQAQRLQKSTNKATPFGKLYALDYGYVADLSGAVFEVYSAEENIGLDGTKYYSKDQKVGTMTTANGKAKLGNLEIGKYYTKEVQTPAGFILNSEKIPFEIKYENQTVNIVQSAINAKNDLQTLKMKLLKLQQVQTGLVETGTSGEIITEDVAAPNKTFVVGTVNEIKAHDGKTAVPAGGLLAVETTDKAGKISISTKLPDGKYFVQEVKTTENYELDSKKYEFELKATNNNKEVEIDLNQLTNNNKPFINKLIPPTFKTTATNDEDDSNKLSPEEQVVIKDTISYTNLFTDGREYTAKGKLYNKATGLPLLVDGKEVTGETKFKPTKPDGFVEVFFTFNASALFGEKVVVFEDVYQDKIHVGMHHDITDEGQTVEITNPQIGTLATNTLDGSKTYDPEDVVEMEDEVSYSDLLPGYEYELRGVLMDAATGEPKLNESGKEITAKAVFVPETENGTAKVVFKFSAENARGAKLVVFEELYRYPKGTSSENEDDPNFVTDHKDIEDEGQTVFVTDPKIRTHASFNPHAQKIEDRLEKLVIRDVIRIEDAVLGREYDALAEVINPETGEPVLDSEGNPLKHRVTFTLGAENTFITSVSKNNNTEIPSTEEEPGEPEEPTGNPEEAENEGEAAPETEDPAANGEVPKDPAADEDSEATEEAENEAEPERLIAIRDGVIGYVDEEGTIVEEISTIDTTDFPAGTRVDGYTFVDVEINAEDVKDLKSIVFYETIFRNDTPVADHKDPEDPNQTVEFTDPELKTTLMGIDEKDKEFNPNTVVELTDIVEMTNVKNGFKYLVKGTLMNKATNKPIEDKDGKTYVSEVEVTVDVEGAKYGEVVSTKVEVKFTVDASALKGVEIVAFESLSRDGTILAKHEDINDPDQTVKILKPELKTTATSNGKKSVSANGTITIDDAVEYKNLKVGEEYRVEGVLMNKATNKPFLVDNKKVTAFTKFKAIKPNGVVTLSFVFEGTGLETLEVVAFEKVFNRGDEIANHEDIKDRGQTVKIEKLVTPKTPTKPRRHLPQTNGSMNNPFVIGLVILILAAAVYLFFQKKSKEQN